MRRVDRRTLLASASAGLALALAGCGSGTDGSRTTGSTPTRTGTTTSSPTPTETAPPTATPTTPAATPTETTPPTATPSPEQLRSSARAFVLQLSAGEFEAARERFAPSLAEKVDVPTLRRVWKRIEGQFGSLVATEGTRSTTVQGRQAAVVTVRFAKARQGIRVVFDSGGRVAGFQIVAPDAPDWTPPEYADEAAFEEHSLELAGPENCRLPAKVTVPTEGEGVPAAVIVGGSGPTDLDGTVGPNLPYRDLAYGLATRGVAVLRYSKRTAACRVDPTTLTIDGEVTEDALTALERIREVDRVDPRRSVVVGHSLGAMLAPRIAARDGQVAGAALLAPPGRALAKTILDQVQYLANRDGTLTPAEQSRIDRVRTAVERIQNLEIAEGETVLGGGRPYWRSLQEYDRFRTARELSIPLFLARGARDYQVTEADLERWRRELSEQSGVTVREYESLNHLFVSGSGEPGPQEYQTPGHVARRVVVDLAEWIGGLASKSGRLGGGD